MNRSVVTILAGVVVTLVAAIVVLYLFGTPQPPDPSTSVVRQEATSPVQEAPVVSDGEVPPPDPNTPLAIEIPGCKCHSDDPKLVEQHAAYRMNQCAGCHAGAVPTGQ